MPAVSENQRKLACIALSIKKGETEKSYSNQAAKMAESMSMDELEKFCKHEVKE